MSNISNSRANTLVSGTNSADSIRNSASGVTIHGGLGNDTLTGSSYGDVFQFRSDGGNDVITNFTSNDTLYISAGSFNGSTVNGNDLIIGAKGTSYSGTIRLLGAANIPVKLKDGGKAVQTINSVNFVNNIIPNDKVDGTNSRDVVSNYAIGAKIDARSDNDTVLSIGDNVSIEGGLGNDSLRSIEGRNVTIHGGGGNDTLTGSSDFNSIFQFSSDRTEEMMSLPTSEPTILCTSPRACSTAIPSAEMI